MAGRKLYAAAVAALVVLAAAVPAMAAFNLNSCSSGSTLSVGSCVTGTATKGDKTTLTWTIGASDPILGSNTQVRLLVWNIQQTATGWPTTLSGSGSAYLITPHSDRSATTPTATMNPQYIQGTTTTTGSTTPTAVTFGFVFNMPAPICAGVYTLVIDATSYADSMAFAAYAWSYDGTVTPAVTPTNSANLNGMYLPGDSISVDVNAPFTMMGAGYIVSQLTATVQVGVSSLAATSTKDGWSVDLQVGGGSLCGSNSALTMNPSAPSVSYACVEVSRPTDITTVEVTTPAISSTTYFPNGYDWKTNGPFLPLTVAIAYTEYPSSATGDVLDNLPATSPKTMYRVYKVSADQWWYSVTVSVDDVKDVVTSSPLSNSLPSVQFAPWNVNSVGAISTNGVGANGLTYYNSKFAQSNGYPKSTWLSAAQPFSPAFVFVKVSLSGCNAPKISYSLSTATVGLSGQCKTIADCNPVKGDGAGNKEASVNTDASRMRICGVTVDPNSPAGMLKPVTQCMECASDCDCNEGQFCNMDPGLCSDGTNQWVCDREMTVRYGFCMNKNSNILGSPCRTSSAVTYSTTSTASYTINSRSSLPIVSPSAGDNSYDPKAKTGVAGFCGEVRLYNSTGFGKNYATVAGGNVRSVLWAGACVNQVCMECQPGFSAHSTLPSGGLNAPCTANRGCVNGMIVNNVYVDWTYRTYTKNAIAGTMLGTLFMIVIACICVCAHIFVQHKLAAGGAAPDKGVHDVKTANPVAGV